MSQSQKTPSRAPRNPLERLQGALALLVVAGTPACLGPPTPVDEGLQLSLRRTGYELAEVDVEGVPGGVDEVTSNVARRRTGVRIGNGSEEVSGYIDFVVEDFVRAGAAGDRFHSMGVRGGLAGRPPVRNLREGLDLVVPYEVGVGAIFGDSDTNESLYYADFAARVGLGLVSGGGLHAGAGLFAQGLGGEIEQDIPPFVGPNDSDLDAFNAGGFLELGLRREALTLEVLLFVGDVRGVGVAFGVVL